MDMNAAAAYRPNQEPPRPYVQFEMRAMEDRSVVSPDGVTHMVDVPWAIVRAPQSKDTLEKKAEEWLAQLKTYAKDGRIPSQWPREYQEAFDLWKKGEEVSPIGTAIKTWPPLTPAQRKNILAQGILTVEDLAAANDEGRAKLGMGAHGLQAMAVTWLEEAKSKGSTAQALADAMLKLADAQALIAEQTAELKRLQAANPPPKSTTLRAT